MVATQSSLAVETLRWSSSCTISNRKHSRLSTTLPPLAQPDAMTFSSGCLPTTVLLGASPSIEYNTPVDLSQLERLFARAENGYALSADELSELRAPTQADILTMLVDAGYALSAEELTELFIAAQHHQLRLQHSLPSIIKGQKARKVRKLPPLSNRLDQQSVQLARKSGPAPEVLHGFFSRQFMILLSQQFNALPGGKPVC
mmetsp:Transcript_60250/g.138244  ORF Transcript_60250/g.138244 Transcript_60250/m.138244 type:complete len:202 (-) Transcript_60250:95-700(-)